MEMREFGEKGRQLRSHGLSRRISEANVSSVLGSR